MIKCIVCGKANYQTATKKMVFDAYCIACRGQINYAVNIKKVNEQSIVDALMSQSENEQVQRRYLTNSKERAQPRFSGRVDFAI